MQVTDTITISLDTPIAMLTPRQLFEMMSEWQKANVVSEQSTDTSDNGTWYVNSYKELADILGTSVSTIYRMRREGLLDKSCSQYGKWVLIDVNSVIETFKADRFHDKVRKGGRPKRGLSFGRAKRP